MDPKLTLNNCNNRFQRYLNIIYKLLFKKIFIVVWMIIKNHYDREFYIQFVLFSEKKLNIHYRSLEIFVYKKVLEPDDQYILCEFKNTHKLKNSWFKAF